MEKLTLSAVTRDLTVKTSELRTNKLVPAVVYGHNLAPVHVSVGTSDFLRLFRKAGKTHLIELSIDGKKHSVLAHEVQKHPVTGDFLHIDFFAVSAKEKIHVAIPVSIVGKSQAQLEGALIETNLHQIDVKVLPANLVDSIEVSIEALVHIGDVVHVSDIMANYPKLEFITPATDAIVSAHAPKPNRDAEEEEAAAAAASAASTAAASATAADAA
ncbi:MAG: large subunit ribosomal protein [Patescibacteria group bacterium]|nr:large subunit ribosomal protein [Patescibacteria group bacterium]